MGRYLMSSGAVYLGVLQLPASNAGRELCEGYWTNFTKQPSPEQHWEMSGLASDVSIYVTDSVSFGLILKEKYKVY